MFLKKDSTNVKMTHGLKLSDNFKVTNIKMLKKKKDKHSQKEWKHRHSIQSREQQMIKHNNPNKKTINS